MKSNFNKFLIEKFFFIKTLCRWSCNFYFLGFFCNSDFSCVRYWFIFKNYLKDDNPLVFVFICKLMGFIFSFLILIFDHSFFISIKRSWNFCFFLLLSQACSIIFFLLDLKLFKLFRLVSIFSKDICLFEGLKNLERE